MGTHGSFGILLERSKDFIYVTCSSNGSVECMGESLLSILRTEGIEGLICAMRDSDLERVDHKDDPIFSVSSMEQYQEWTFSDWTYLYRKRTDSLLVCYPERIGEEKGNLGITGQNPYAKERAALSVLLEVPVCGTETVMDVWGRTRSLKRVGRYLTVYM
jgi:hypothetical protein